MMVLQIVNTTQKMVSISGHPETESGMSQCSNTLPRQNMNTAQKMEPIRHTEHILKATQSSNTLPRTRAASGPATAILATSTSKVKLRRRLSINPSWKAGSREVRRSRSFSAHSATMEESPSKPTTSTPTASPTYMRRRHKPLVVKRVPAADLEPTTMAGYMDRKSFNGQWNKYWYVLHEGTLFCYLTSDDNVTVDVLNLHGYDVTEMVDKFRLKRFVIQLSHEKFTSLFLSLDTREEMSTWRDQLLSARQRPSSTARDDCDDDKGACAGCESNRADDMKDKRTIVKQKLLDEMLRQKHELERKRAERHKRQRGKDPDTDPSRTNDFTADEQRTSDVTRLRQRRMSTQLKVDAIEKQMLPKSTNQKRGLFSFGKQKKVDENKNIFLQDQLKELCGKLDKIDTDLTQVRQETPLDVYDVNQNRKQSAVVCNHDLTSFLNGEADNDVVTARTSSGLKAAMHKLTNKTFSKTSTKRKGIPANKTPHNGSVPNISKQNGDVRSHSYDDNDPNMDGYMSSDNSVTDLTRPTADLKLDLDIQFSPTSTVGSQSSVSPTSTHSYARSNSRNSSGSLPSPRREIKASVLAEIDAFEEMTRQVLGARSKEMPTA